MMSPISTIISGVVSLGVLAGVVSGIFYLVVAGIRWAGHVRRRQTSPDIPEARPQDIKKASERLSGDNESGEDSGDIDRDTLQVREFIEKLVEKLIGGHLDSVTVGKLSNHPDYIGFFNKYHGLLCQALARLGFALQLSLSNKSVPELDTPSAAHAALKTLVEKIVHEAMSLPQLHDIIKPMPNGQRETNDFSNKTYEDILATAILNKVIDGYQKERKRSKNIDRNRNIVQSSQGSGYDDDTNSDWSDNSKTEPLSLTIEERIEEVTTTYDSSEDEGLVSTDECHSSNGRAPFPECGVDVVDADFVGQENDDTSTEIINPLDSWQDNWLFQKKKLRTSPNSHHPVPVPMLVPNPSQEYRALIGGVDADDLSDMSECSDSALEDVLEGGKEDMNSKTDKSGQATPEIETNETEEIQSSKVELIEVLEEKIEEPTECQIDPLNEEDRQHRRQELAEESASRLRSFDPSNHIPSFEIGKRLLSPIEDLSSIDSPEHSLSQKDRDYGEDYEEIATIIRNDIPVPKPRSIDVLAYMEPTSEKPPKCPIAEREKAKWKNAAPMANNPYTVENIEKRLSAKKNDILLTRDNNATIVESPPVQEEIKVDLKIMDESLEEPRYTRDYYINTSPKNSSESEDKLDETEETLSQVEVRRQSSDLERVKRLPESRRSYAFEEITLPSVKELAKNFMKPSPKPRNLPRPLTKAKSMESLHQTQYTSVSRASLERDVIIIESEMNEVINSSNKDIFESLKKESQQRMIPKNSEEKGEEIVRKPISQIIYKFTTSINTPREKIDVQQRIFQEVAQIQKESRPSSLEKQESEESEVEMENTSQFLDRLSETTPEILPSKPKQKYAPKLVHSLTARSISKEFREGLKQYSSRNLNKIDRGSSGESDQGERIPINHIEKPSTPPFDVRKSFKFWEEKAAAKKM